MVYEGNYCIATARLVHLSPQDAQIGRMAVLQDFRGRGVGKVLLKKLIDLAGTQGISRLVLHSQVSAVPFYEKVGFIAEGPIYDEAGIPHRNMMLLLPKTTSSFCHL
jgi:predicted GNAT family N-acyltransferase